MTALPSCRLHFGSYDPTPKNQGRLQWVVFMWVLLQVILWPPFCFITCTSSAGTFHCSHESYMLSDWLLPRTLFCAWNHGLMSVSSLEMWHTLIKMTDITPDMVQDFFNFAKPLPKELNKVTAKIHGPTFSESDAYKPEFKLQRKPSVNRWGLLVCITETFPPQGSLSFWLAHESSSSPS